MKLHKPSCVYVAIKCSGCSDSIPLQSPDVFDIAVARFESQGRGGCKRTVDLKLG